jgi:hypothetical protein
VKLSDTIGTRKYPLWDLYMHIVLLINLPNIVLGILKLSYHITYNIIAAMADLWYLYYSDHIELSKLSNVFPSISGSMAITGG